MTDWLFGTAPGVHTETGTTFYDSGFCTASPFGFSGFLRVGFGFVAGGTLETAYAADSDVIAGVLRSDRAAFYASFPLAPRRLGARFPAAGAGGLLFDSHCRSVF